MEKRDNLLLTIIAIATLLVAVIGATFAFFASSKNFNGLGVDIELDGKYPFLAAFPSGDISLTIFPEDMQEGYADNDNQANNPDIASNLTSEASLNVTLSAAKEGTLSTCTYDVVFVWGGEEQFTDYDNLKEIVGTDNKYYPNKYYVRTGYNPDDITTDEFKEFTITGTVYLDNKNTDKVIAIPEKNIDEFGIMDETTHKIVLKKGQSISNDSTENLTYNNWVFDIKFYNRNEDQSNLMGKKFQGKITIDNISCK